MTYLWPASRCASTELATLTGLGNGRGCPERTHTGDQLGHVVLLDPEGNEFCVA
jgi:hypothetical protein